MPVDLVPSCNCILYPECYPAERAGGRRAAYYASCAMYERRISFRRSDAQRLEEHEQFNRKIVARAGGDLYSAHH